MGYSKNMSALLVISMTLSLGLVYSAVLNGNGDQTASYWPIGPHQINKRESMHYCGDRLREAIRSLCKGSYATITRRSDPALANTGLFGDSMERESMRSDLVSAPSSSNTDLSQQYGNDWEVESPVNDFDSMWPNNPKALALRILTEGPTHQRIRRNIHNECCIKSCSTRALLRYCGRN